MRRIAYITTAVICLTILGLTQWGLRTYSNARAEWEYKVVYETDWSEPQK